MGFLRREEGWLTIGVIRAKMVKTLRGGYSSVARALLRSLFLGNDGVSIAGVVVHLLGSPRVLYFRFDKLLADEAMTKNGLGRHGAWRLEVLHLAMQKHGSFPPRGL